MELKASKFRRPSAPASPRDRATLDFLRISFRIRYIELLEVCKEVTGREVRGIGGLTTMEIKKVKRRIRNGLRTDG